MSSCNNKRAAALSTSAGHEKKVLRALASSGQAQNDLLRLNPVRSELSSAKKHSSATLLRRKLKGHLVRELKSA